MMKVRTFGGFITLIVRIIGTILLFLLAMFLFGQGLPSLATISPVEALLIGSLVLMLGGLALAWKWEGVGAILVLSGFAGFWLVSLAMNGGLWMNWSILLIPAVGAYFLFDWLWQTGRLEWKR